LLTSRSEDACREAASSITPKPHFVASNVSNRAGCEALAEHASQLFDNKLDVLINNAGASWGEPLDRTSGRANWGFDKVLDLVRNKTKRNQKPSYSFADFTDARPKHPKATMGRTSWIVE
jgi:NAD(P)-dependent dehydrogenase (short-subunit alcohol dehydrogenase family)